MFGFDDVQRSVRYFRRKLRKYGLTLDSFLALLDAQHGKCAICDRKEEVNINRAMAIDHDHQTGKVRGLLCMSCNIMLGKAKDDPEILRKAADYIERHRDTCDLTYPEKVSTTC